MLWKSTVSALFRAIHTKTVLFHKICTPMEVEVEGWIRAICIRCNCCRKILTSNMFGTCTTDLRKALADFIRHICVSEVDIKDNKSSLESFLTCRLVPLDQSPALRPIGIGDFLKRIADKVANGSSWRWCNYSSW